MQALSRDLSDPPYSILNPFDIFGDLSSLETGTILAGSGAAFSVNRNVLEEQKRREWERDQESFASAAIGGASGRYAPYTEKQFEEIDFL